VLPHHIDQPFLNQLESKNPKIKFQRIDADLTDDFKTKTSKKVEKELEEEAEAIGKIIKKALKKEQVAVRLEKLKNKKISAMVTLSEESRRMQDMMKMYAMPGMDTNIPGMGGETLVLNANHPLVQYVLEHKNDDSVSDSVVMICEQLYDLAMLQHSPLDAEAMARFVARSNDIMLKLAE
jgi:molecular chaperone HtpG